MALVTVEEAKQYLRVDGTDEDALVAVLLSSAQSLCEDVARLTPLQWEIINKVKLTPCGRVRAIHNAVYTRDELNHIRPTMKVAVLYALAYLYEHREEADHHELTLTLRALLSTVREGVF